MTEQTGFALNEDGDMFMDPVTKSLAMTATTPETVRQRITTELSTFFAEYTLNYLKGLPYIPEILDKNADPRKSEALITTYLSTIKDVKRVLEVSVDLNSADRELRVSFKVSLSSGDIVEGVI